MPDEAGKSDERWREKRRGGSETASPPSTRPDLPLATPDEAEEKTRAVRRLHQLSVEIEIGLTRNDPGLVRCAARLLGPALERCRELNAIGKESDAELLALAIEARTRLDAAETRLTREMANLSLKMKRLNHSRRVLARARSQFPEGVSRRLDVRL